MLNLSSHVDFLKTIHWNVYVIGVGSEWVHNNVNNIARNQSMATDQHLNERESVVVAWVAKRWCTKKNKKNFSSHKIFMVMLATLLPCLFSAMHTYTPLSVRFNPLVNVNACTDERISLVSKRFQWYFGAEFGKIK